MKLLMIDNYDSFTYNIVQYFGELGADVEVFRNDEITVAEIEARLNAGQLDRLVISPGPCSPAEAGISVAAIQHFAGQLPILGVCLGHQSIGAAFGGKIVRAQQLMHGKTSVITTTQQGVFAGLPPQFTVNCWGKLANTPFWSVVITLVLPCICWPARMMSPPNAAPMLWWPRHTPKMGSCPAKC